MVWLKTCPRCNGDLVLESDFYGHFITCIQCGNVLSEPQERLLSKISRRTLPEPQRQAFRAALQKVAVLTA